MLLESSLGLEGVGRAPMVQIVAEAGDQQTETLEISQPAPPLGLLLRQSNSRHKHESDKHPAEINTRETNNQQVQTHITSNTNAATNKAVNVVYGRSAALDEVFSTRSLARQSIWEEYRF